MKIKEKSYRIVQVEDNLGYKRFESQIQVKLLFGLFKDWKYIRYYDDGKHIHWLNLQWTPFTYEKLCDAKKAISIWGLFGNDPEKRQIKSIW